MGKAFEKQIKSIEDQGEKQAETLKNLKPKEQTKATEGESNNQSKAAKILSNLITERNIIMNKLYESVNINKLYFKYEGNPKDLSFLNI